MPTFFPIQTSFDAGELSPRTLGRVDADLYKRGLALCENFEPLVTGPIRKRGGTVKVAELLAGGHRLIPFKTSSGLDYVLELGALVMRIYSLAGGVLPLGGTGNLLTNGGFDAGYTGWSGALSNLSLVNGAVRIRCIPEPYPQQGYIQQTFTVSAPGVYRVQYEVTPGMKVMIGLAPAASTMPAPILNLTAPGDFTLPAGDLVIRFQGPAGTDPAAGNAYFYVDNVSVVAVEAAAEYVITTPWSVERLPGVQYVLETGKDRMVFVHPNVAPWFLARSAAGGWTYGTAVLTHAATGWAGENWPSTCEIFNGRLWLGGTPADGNRVWGSRIGKDKLFDFTLGTGLATDAIDLDVSTKGAFKWIQGQRNLLLGTDIGEHYSGSPDGVIAPGSENFMLGSAFGSAPIQAVAAGDQVLYISADRRKPRVIGFEYQADGWVTHDLALLADHMTKALIREAHFAKAPYPCAPLLLTNGTMGMCSYDRAAPMLAWWKLLLPGGTINSAAVTDGANGSIVWLSVQRETGVFLEAFWLDDDSLYLLDSQVAIEAPASGVLGGLAHLEGALVQAITAQGFVEYTVAGGQITLEAGTFGPGEVVYVGLPYLARAKTLPLEGGNPAGTSQGMVVQRPTIKVRLNNSAAPMVNGQTDRRREGDAPYDSADALRSWDMEVSNDADGATVTIEQELPFRTEICAIFGPAKLNTVNG
jgi:hypothetical protein